MGNSNSCIRHLKDVFSSLMGGSSESETHQTAPTACEGERPTSSCGTPLVEGSEGAMERNRSVVEDRIESSKVHWSELSKLAFDSDDEGAVENDNWEVFRILLSHPTWIHFFWSLDDFGSLEVGEKFAEGGQAELFRAHVTWKDPKNNEECLEEGREFVLKVFKKGTLLRYLQSQWPHGLLQFKAEEVERRRLNLPPPTLYFCDVLCGTMLKGGRFAFLMGKEQEDLRSLIDRTMLSIGKNQRSLIDRIMLSIGKNQRSLIDRIMLSIGKNHGPFSKNEGEQMMFKIAKGMDWLHSHNVVHRDLKAANVLTYKHSETTLTSCYVADYECSVGVVGTRFFRAPEILQAVQNMVVSKRLEVFSKEADVYSYGMTCYEILTGELPFNGHPASDCNLIFKGQRPKVPKYVDNWVRELLKRCWQEDPATRPSFGEIVNIFLANSSTARNYHLDVQQYEERLMKKYKESLLLGDLVVEPQ